MVADIPPPQTVVGRADAVFRYDDGQVVSLELQEHFIQPPGVDVPAEGILLDGPTVVFADVHREVSDPEFLQLHQLPRIIIGADKIHAFAADDVVPYDPIEEGQVIHLVPQVSGEAVFQGPFVGHKGHDILGDADVRPVEARSPVDLMDRAVGLDVRRGQVLRHERRFEIRSLLGGPYPENIGVGQIYRGFVNRDPITDVRGQGTGDKIAKTQEAVDGPLRHPSP